MDNVVEREARRLAQQRKSDVFAFRRVKWGDPRPLRRRRWPRLVDSALVVVIAGALGYSGWAILGSPGLPELPTLAGPAVAATTSLAQPHMRMCGYRERNTSTKTCLVDGDTIWLAGTKYRLESYDTPEPQTDICGGAAEVALAHKASARLLQLLNSNPWTIETRGAIDLTGSRTLATIRIDGRDVGDILISERLARHWPDGDEWWCR